ncbi:MAG: B12-binding domain-containing radical SAM protein [Promethearchaeota archaeon]
MSGYTTHFLYSLFNSHPHILCERFFIPDKRRIPLFKEEEKIIGNNKQTIRSIDSGTPLSDFDIIGFTLQYEFDYLNVLWVIDSLGIPFFVKERSGLIGDINSQDLELKGKNDEMEYGDYNQACGNEINHHYPLLIAGGPCLKSNPLAMMPFLDILVLGDFEVISDDFIETLVKHSEILSKFDHYCKYFLQNMEKQEFNNVKNSNLKNNNGNNNCKDAIRKYSSSRLIDNKINKIEKFNENVISLITELIKMPNIIISLFGLMYLEELQYKEKIRNKSSIFSRVFPKKQMFLKDLSRSPAPLRQIIPEFEDSKSELIFGNSYLLEINRGCPYKCNFCITGHLNGNFRYRKLENIKEIALKGLKQTPTEKIALIGSAISDHPNIKQVFQFFINQNIKFIIPSIRIDRLDTEIMELLYKNGTRSLTIAPEAGSDLLRKKINKHISNEEIIEKCKQIFSLGFTSLKFYFIFGFPEETKEDIDSIIDLIAKIGLLVQKFSKQKKHPIKLRLSINIFIPKLLTPFGYYSQNFSSINIYLKKTRDYLLKNLKKLRNEKKYPIEVEIMEPKDAFIQFILSQIDERFSKLLYQFYISGGNFIALKKLVYKSDFTDIFGEFFKVNRENKENYDYLHRISKIKKIFI